MNQSPDLQISQCEKRLKESMLHSDISALQELLAPDLIFTNHLGQTMSKADDIEAHRSGILSISEITLSEQKISVVSDVAIVTVRARIVGSYAGIKSESDFRFTRIWGKTSSESWQVIAGHSCLVT